MIPGFILFILVAILDWVAVVRNWKRVEYFAKPMTLTILLGILVFTGKFGNGPLICFTLGIFFSLLGDIFLMITLTRFSNLWFMLGLASFLATHVAYIIGLNIPLPDVSPLWSLGLAILLGLTASRILRKILTSIRQKGLRRLVIPVAAYGIIISVMLLSALLTIYNPTWSSAAAGLVSLGAILFCFSDLLLAWNKFVSPIRKGRLANMISYHLGQAALVAGILLQFSN